METVIVIGELLWDYFGDHRVAAGAPYNFARHLKFCGQKPFFISSVGDDADGKALKAEVEKIGLDGEILTSKRFPTGYAKVITENGKNRFELGNPSAWDDIILIQGHIEILKPYRYIYYGSLAQRFDFTRNTIHLMVEEPLFKRIFDINLRPPFDDYYMAVMTILWNLDHCDILKISSEDMAILKTFPMFKDLEDVIEFLFEHTQIEMILETLGEEGARYHDRTGKTIFCPAPKVEVTSTVGAGDAFLASFISGMISGQEPEVSLKQAVDYAARVISTPLS